MPVAAAFDRPREIAILIDEGEDPRLAQVRRCRHCGKMLYRGRWNNIAWILDDESNGTVSEDSQVEVNGNVNNMTTCSNAYQGHKTSTRILVNFMA